MILSQEQWMELRAFKALADAGATWAEIARRPAMTGGQRRTRIAVANVVQPDAREARVRRTARTTWRTARGAAAGRPAK
jgi:hypothetical protein